MEARDNFHGNQYNLDHFHGPVYFTIFTYLSDVGLIKYEIPLVMMISMFWDHPLVHGDNWLIPNCVTHIPR